MITIKFKEWTCFLEFDQYQNNLSTAISLIGLEGEYAGEPIATASVNVPNLTLPTDQVAIKDWSENEGVLKALVDAGVVKVLYQVPTGYAIAHVCQILKRE